MKFEIPELSAMVVANVNPRTEQHEDAMVPALDVRIEWETTSAVLDKFHPELRGALYWANEAARAQNTVEGVDPVSGNLIFPDLDALRWKAKVEQRYTFAIELPSLAPVVLANCKLGPFVLDSKEGGSVVVGFRLQACPVGEREAGKLATMIGARVLATLRPQVDAEGSDGSGEPTAGEPRPDLHAWPFGVTGDQLPESAKPQTRKGNRRSNQLEREAEDRERATAAFLAGSDDNARADSEAHDTTGH